MFLYFIHEYVSLAKRIGNVQRRLICFILWNLVVRWLLSHQGQRFIITNVDQTKRIRHAAYYEVFKILNGYENIDRNIFFTVKEERRTRGHGVTLAKKQCRLDIRHFQQRTVNEWNRLSADCVGASSVNIFKNKIDIYLRRAGYT